METIFVTYNGEIYELQRKVKMNGTWHYVNLNGEMRGTQDVTKPFSVVKLPKGAKKKE